MWTARLLDSAPVSGSVAERHYDNGLHVASWVWVRFELDGQAWAGTFRCGDLATYRAVHVVPTVDDAVVVAGGCAYWISLSTQEIRYSHEYVVHSAVVPERPLVVAATFSDIAILSAAGPRWCPNRVAMDGITITSVTQRYVRGEAEGYSGPATFVLDIDSLELQGGVPQA